jgi:hypothetical protein
MADIIEKRWWSYSKRNDKFEILGYSILGGDCRDDAAEAMEDLSKYLHEPIPSDVELCILPLQNTKSERSTESEEAYAG